MKYSSLLCYNQLVSSNAIQVQNNLIKVSQKNKIRCYSSITIQEPEVE